MYKGIENTLKRICENAKNVKHLPVPRVGYTFSTNTVDNCTFEVSARIVLHEEAIVSERHVRVTADEVTLFNVVLERSCDAGDMERAAIKTLQRLCAIHDDDAKHHKQILLNLFWND